MPLRMNWSDADLRLFIDIFKREIKARRRPVGLFRRFFWTIFVIEFKEKAGKILTKRQFKNKWNNMQKEYTWFMELKNAAAGLEWDDAKQTVHCSKEWWDEHLARCSNPEKGIKCNHMRFRYHGPKHLDDLHIMFGKIHVSGTGTTANRLCRNTCRKVDSAAEKITTIVEASSAPPTNLVPSIAEAMKMVKGCGVQEKTALMHTSTSLILKPEFREVFSCLETNEGRFDLLEREHDMKITSAAEKITSVEASLAPPTNLAPSIVEAMKMVKGCGVQEKTALMHTSMSLIVKPEFREVFSLLETNEGRFDLLEREYEKMMMKRI